ncbi:hypothetical protein [Sphingomonas melonis]|uniref:Uncharacterized protein n=1 Tax=Sphingomonas melonis TaxID=152682 RepID=A0A7Y9FSF3_9SPHN|nr:hypothetical protein [Sphingomonas melonis]NYD91411.1 hypothetical protein [Sphingomonas melonis]
MINVAQTRAQIEAIEGEALIVPKQQLFEMLSEVELGQHARRALTNVRSLVNIASSVSRAQA